jgi:hypothetical protein
VEGWLAFSTQNGISPDDIFVTLKTQDGTTRYLTTHRKPRPDVNEKYHQSSMPDVGYTTNIDIEQLRGEYFLGLAMGYKGRVIQCKNINMPLKIRNDE